MEVATDGRWPLVGRDAELARADRLLAQGRSVLIAGPAGSGKARLAAAVAERWPGELLSVVGSEAAGEVPLGALAAVLEPTTTRQATRADQLHEVVRRLIGDRHRPLLVVDDAQWLGELSAAALRQAVATGTAAALVTLRTGSGAPSAVTALWTADVAARLDLGPLDETAMGALLEAVLGGAVDRPSLARIAALTSGSALHLRELVLAALETDRLAASDGVWRLDAVPAGAPRLVDLVEDRLASLAPSARTLLETLAFAEGEGPDLLGRVAELAPLADLEARGLVIMATDRRRRVLRLAHPLHGEVVRAAVPRARAAEIQADLADALAAVGARRQGDVLRLARWRLESGGPAGAPTTVAAATAAYVARDDGLAEELAVVALDAGGAGAARWVLGAAQQAQGRNAEAERTFAAVDLDALLDGDPELAFRVAERRAENLFWGLGRAEEARAVLARTRDRLEDPGAADALTAVAAGYDLMAGRPLAVLDQIAHIAKRRDDSEAIIAALISAPALVQLGRVTEALETADHGIALRLARADEEGLSELGLLVVARIQALLESGRLAEAAAEAEAGYQIALAEGVTVGQAWLALMRGWLALLAGEVATADTWFAEAAARFADLGLEGCRRWCIGSRAWAAALAGRREEARGLAAEEAGIDDRGITMMEPELGRGRAAVAVAMGQADAALAHLDAARELARRSQWTLATRAAHDRCRLTAAAEDLEALRSAAAHVDGALAPALVAHAEAMVADDAGGLDRAGERLAELGLYLLAAEAAAAAADAHRRAGSARAATRSVRRARELAARTEGARTPGLVLVDEPVALTRREREVAVLTAEGRRTREVADRLGVSVRTVENHLHRAYAKLGIEGRDELAEALGLSSGSR